MMTALIAVAAGFVYMFGVGVTARLFGWEDADDWEDPRPFFWPIACPMWIGAALIAFFFNWWESRKERLPRAQVHK